jgi:hypothetical protein
MFRGFVPMQLSAATTDLRSNTTREAGMWCPQCGANNEEAAKFCNRCGLDYTNYRAQWQATGTQAGGTPVPAARTPAAQASGFEPPCAPGYEGVYQYPQPRPISATIAPPQVPSYLGWAIAVLILCFWPTGIVAVVYAGQVGDRLALGNVEGAWDSSRKAKMWCWISFAILIIAVIVGFYLGLSSIRRHSGYQ